MGRLCVDCNSFEEIFDDMDIKSILLINRRRNETKDTISELKILS